MKSFLPRLSLLVLAAFFNANIVQANCLDYSPLAEGSRACGRDCAQSSLGLGAAILVLGASAGLFFGAVKAGQVGDWSDCHYCNDNSGGRAAAAGSVFAGIAGAVFAVGGIYLFVKSLASCCVLGTHGSQALEQSQSQGNLEKFQPLYCDSSRCGNSAEELLANPLVQLYEKVGVGKEMTLVDVAHTVLIPGIELDGLCPGGQMKDQSGIESWLGGQSKPKADSLVASIRNSAQKDLYLESISRFELLTPESDQIHEAVKAYLVSKKKVETFQTSLAGVDQEITELDGKRATIENQMRDEERRQNQANQVLSAPRYGAWPVEGDAVHVQIESDIAPEYNAEERGQVHDRVEEVVRTKASQDIEMSQNKMAQLKTSLAPLQRSLADLSSRRNHLDEQLNSEKQTLAITEKSRNDAYQYFGEKMRSLPSSEIKTLKDRLSYFLGNASEVR